MRKNVKGRTLCIGLDNTCIVVPIRKTRCAGCFLREFHNINIYTTKKLTREDFVLRSSLYHDNKYDYSNVVYKGNKLHVTIKCPTHGDFTQSATAHMKGNGCRKCSPSHSKDTEAWIEAVVAVHGARYDYGEAVYIDCNTVVKIRCRKHGPFEQLPGSHLQGKGCIKCGIDKSAEASRKDIDHFLQKARKCHGDRYDYSKVVYTGSGTDVTIICTNCKAEFNQTPDNHYNGKGCPHCVKSRMEINIARYLHEHNIPYIEQERFRSCADTRPLPFDFYLHDHNMLIEADGQQHFQSVGYWGGDASLQKQIRRDKIKDEWARQNDYVLLRISYGDEPIAILDKVIPIAHTLDPCILATDFYRTITVRDCTGYKFVSTL
jgi:hypothetical protein